MKWRLWLRLALPLEGGGGPLAWVAHARPAPAHPATPFSSRPGLHAGGLYGGAALEAAIQRYWRLWMPLLAEHQACPRRRAQAGLLRPPLDVAWAWFAHRLNPTQYLVDVR